MSTLVPEIGVHLAPGPPAWAQALSHGHAAGDQQARQFRAELGLPIDKRIVMSGHQAQFWHAGILAKHLACVHSAARFGAHAAWIVVDRDEPEFHTLRYPVRTQGGSLAQRVWHATPPQALEGLGPSPTAAAARAFDPQPIAPPGEEVLLPGVAAGLELARAALVRQRGAANAAEQVARAAAELAANIGGGGAAPTLIYASHLNRSTLFRELVVRMATRPEACHAAYNAAVETTPGARLAPLARDRDGTRLELPLWRIDAAGSRHRVWSTDLSPGALDAERIAQLTPRALLLTGLLRLAGCDLFIHGTGGAGTDGAGGYDRATARWFASWLGGELAPCAVATGTMLLPLLDRAPTGAAEVVAARFAAHHARHTPGALGEWGAEREKRTIAAAIDASTNRPLRARLYKRMHLLLGDMRTAHAVRLRAFARRAEALAASANADRLAADRTWPFVLHDAASLAQFSDLIRARLEANA